MILQLRKTTINCLVDINYDVCIFQSVVLRPFGHFQVHPVLRLHDHHHLVSRRSSGIQRQVEPERVHHLKRLKTCITQMKTFEGSAQSPLSSRASQNSDQRSF